MNAALPANSKLTGLLAALFVSLPSFVWIALDSRIWPWDQAWYGEVAADLWFRLTQKPGDWFTGMMTLLPQKPPLQSWLGQFLMPLGLATGNIEFALLLVSMLSQVATLWFVWLFARRVSPDDISVAVLALLITAAAPLFVGMGHQFVTEPLQTAVVTGSFYLALLAPRHISLPRGIIMLGIAGFAGLAVKTTTPAYCGLAWALTAWILFRRWRAGEKLMPQGKADWALLAGLLVLGGLTTGWYIHNAGPMLQHVKNVMDPRIALDYGSVGSFVTKITFWSRAVDHAMSLLPFAALIVSFLAIAFLVLRVASHKNYRYATGLVLLGAIHVILVVVQFAFQIIEETRFLAPIVPLLALAIAVALYHSPLKVLTVPAIVAMVVQLVLVHLEAHQRIAKLSGTVWLQTAKLNTQQRVIADQIVANTCDIKKPYQYVVVGLEDPDMNANSLAFHAAQASSSKGYRCYYTGLGYAETDTQKVLQRVESLNPMHIVTPLQERLKSNPNYLNKVSSAFAERMETSNRYRSDNTAVGGMKIYQRQD